MEHEAYDMATSALEVLGVFQGHTNRRCDRPGVNQVKPAEGDDAEQQLRGVARQGVVETELRADRGHRLLAGGEMTQLVVLRAAAQRFPLDQANEVRPAGQESEVVGDGAREDSLGGLAAGQGPCPSCPDGLPDLGKTPLEDRLVQLGLGAEEISRSPTGNAGGGSNLAQTGSVEALLRK